MTVLMSLDFNHQPFSKETHVINDIRVECESLTHERLAGRKPWCNKNAYMSQ